MLVNSVYKPLHTLPMDLFGPTSVSSLNHKWYCLVVTDDFSRVLVIEPHNKTSYELFNERSSAIGFLRPFGCHVMILNTLDHLGKFDAKWDEGYFVGYSLSSKAFKVFNKRTKKIEENLHVDFLENKSIEKGTGPDWLFDIDTLTNSMNYVPVVARTSSTNISGTKENVHQAVKEKESPLRFIALLYWFYEAQMATSNETAKKDDAIPNNNAPQKDQEKVNGDKEVPESSRNSNLTASTKVSTNDSFELASSSIVETKVSTVSTPVPTDSLSVPLVTLSVPRIISRRGSSFPEPLSLGNVMSFENRLEDFFGDTSNAVLKNKKDKRGIVIRNKACLVAQGHTQEEGIDYEEVFAPVARIKAIRLFLAYVSYMGFIVYQMDVKSAFLYETIDEEGKDGTGKDVELYLYKSMIRSLMYLTASRQNIMFAICACARHQVTPKECHLHAVKRIFRYLKGNPMLGLWYPKESSFNLVAHSDSDYGGANQDRKSTTGGCQFLGRRLIFWQCKKQTIMATSTTKARYVAAASGCGQVLWIQNQLLDYGTIELVASMLVPQGKGSENPSEPHHIPSDQYESIHHEQITQSPQHAHITSHEPIPQSYEQTTSQEPTIPSQSHSVITTPRRITRGTIWISQCKVPSPKAYETTFLTGDVRYGEAFPNVTRLDAGQEMENIAKTSAMPHEALPRVTSLGGAKGNAGQEMENIAKTSAMPHEALPRVTSLGGAKGKERIQSQVLEITQLKTRVKTLKDNKRKREGFTQEDDPNIGGWIKGRICTLGVANILASGGLRFVFTTASLSVATGSIGVSHAVATASGSFPTTVIFTTASVVTPTTRVTISSRGVVIGSSSSIYLARDLEAKFAQEDQIIREQAERDYEIARIHAERELEMMITELDRSNEMVVKYLSEYEQAEARLSHNEKVELIDELIMYQRHIA
uniref:Uncharacterized protein n=1 Tax=Tanacetum cinerariifolium TaxID=118510 RepID=A0A6L2PAT1_TANCI|nr:hypothetical protein [Tanacetum cinerariifolium]